jgi:hypothetical protein
MENEAGIVGAAVAALSLQPQAEETDEPVAQDTTQDTSQDDTSF